MRTKTNEAEGGVPRRVWGGTSWLVLGRVVSSACTLATLWILAQLLSGQDFGRLTFWLALFLVLDSFVDLGSGQAAIQLSASATERTRGAIHAARRMRLVAGLVGALLVSGAAFLTGEGGAVWILVASLYPLTHVLEVSTLVFKNEIAWARPTLVRIFASLASLAFVLLFLRAGAREPTLYVLAIASGSTLGNIGLFLASRPRLPREGPSIPWREFLSLALPMGAAGLCQQAYFYIDNLFVRPLCGDASLGHYNLAVRMMSYGLMIAVYATLAALPWLTREHASGRLGPALSRLASPLFCVAGLGFGAAWPWAGELLALFGEGFDAAAPALRWLFAACLCVYVGATWLTGVVACGRARSVLAISAGGLAVNLAGNAWLVPRLGIEGAAAATCATEAFVALAAGVALVRAKVEILTPAALARWMPGAALFFLARAVSSWIGG